MLRHSTEAQTPEEARRIERILTLGCICCVDAGYQRHGERLEVHHLLDGNRRLGHWYTIVLCVGHHQGRFSARQKALIAPEKLVSISSGSRAFVAAFDSDRNLPWLRIDYRVGLGVCPHCPPHHEARWDSGDRTLHADLEFEFDREPENQLLPGDIRFDDSWLPSPDR